MTGLFPDVETDCKTSSFHWQLWQPVIWNRTSLKGTGGPAAHWDTASEQGERWPRAHEGAQQFKLWSLITFIWLQGRTGTVANTWDTRTHAVHTTSTQVRMCVRTYTRTYGRLSRSHPHPTSRGHGSLPALNCQGLHVGARQDPADKPCHVCLGNLLSPADFLWK